MGDRPVTLDERDAQRIVELARDLGISPAEVVRLALDALGAQGADRRFHHFDTGEGDGSSVADLPEETLMSGFGE